MPTETKIGKFALKVSGIITAVTIIIGAFGWVYNEYQEHKSLREKELDQRIDDRIKNHGNQILKEINKKSELFYEVVDSLQTQIDNLIDSERKFAIGFRSDGENLYYRDMNKVDHRVYWNSETGQYYYIENGLAIYL